MDYTMSKPILFIDFNGVLSYNNFWYELESESHQYHYYWPLLQNFLFSRDKEILTQWMLGELTSEDVHQIIQSRLSIPYDFLFPLFVNNCKSIDISYPILDRVEKLKSRYYCILATANMDSLERFTFPANPRIITVFDQIDNSYHIKMFKQTDGGAYFAQTIRKLGAVASSCVLLDDSKSTCAVFDTLGGRSFNVSGVSEALEILNCL
jgi:hypothetical protein